MLVSISRGLGDGTDWCRKPRAEFPAPVKRTEKSILGKEATTWKVVCDLSLTCFYMISEQ